MLRASAWDLEYGPLLKESRRLTPQASWPRVRVALLGDCALQQITPIVAALFARAGVWAEMYEGGYDTADPEVYDPASRLYAFEPQVVVFFDTLQHLRDGFFASDEQRAGYAERVLDKLEGRWKAVAARTGAAGAVIVQSNFPPPFERAFGNYEHKVKTSFTSVVAEIDRGRGSTSRCSSTTSPTSRRTWASARGSTRSCGS